VIEETAPRPPKSVLDILLKIFGTSAALYDEKNAISAPLTHPAEEHLRD
jgi:hypothetical protein